MAWKMTPEDGEDMWRITDQKMNGGGGPQSNNIVVVVRVRPFNQREKDLNTTNCIEMHGEDPENNQCWYVDQSDSSLRLFYRKLNQDL